MDLMTCLSKIRQAEARKDFIEVGRLRAMEREIRKKNQTPNIFDMLGINNPPKK